MKKNEYKSDKLYIVKPSVIKLDRSTKSDGDILGKKKLDLVIVERDITYAKKRKFSDEKIKEVVEKKKKLKKEIKDLESNIAKGNNFVTHAVEFEKSNEDITIATTDVDINTDVDLYPDLKSYDVLSEQVFWIGMFNPHFHQKEMCINVYPDDNMLLLKYLWEEHETYKTKWNPEIFDYACNIKPFYTYEELIAIRDRIKEDSLNNEKEVKKFTRERKYKIVSDISKNLF